MLVTKRIPCFYQKAIYLIIINWSEASGDSLSKPIIFLAGNMILDPESEGLEKTFQEAADFRHVENWTINAD